MDYLNNIISQPLTPVQSFRATIIVFIISSYWYFYHFISAACSVGAFILPSFFLLIKRRAAAGFWNLCLYCLEQNSIELAITGDSISTSESCIVLSNHRSINDFFVLAYLSKLGSKSSFTTPRLNFLTWASLWKVPTIRLVRNVMSYDENWSLDSDELDHQLAKIHDFIPLDQQEVGRPEWLVLFPEVNIFSASAYELQKAQMDKYLVPRMSSVLYPRLTISPAIAKACELDISTLYSVTIVYYNKITKQFVDPTLVSFFSHSPSEFLVRVHVKAKSVSKVPTKAKKVEKWLENEWFEKDRMARSMEQGIASFT